jgi:LysM repeat protein
MTATSEIDSLKIRSFQTPQIPLTDSIINYGKLFLNTRYRHGSSAIGGFDCSGFTSFVYRNFGYNLSRSSSGQADQVGAVDRCNLKTGDLVFFSGRHPSKHVGHVGIVVSADQDGKFNFIHSSNQNGVIISNSEEPYYLKRYIKAGRLIADNQFLAVLHPLNIPENKITEPVADIPVYRVQNPVRQTTKFIPAKFHSVKKGETLSSIAHKFGLTVSELKLKNHIKGNKINPKQHLKIKDAETELIVEVVSPVENKPVETVSEQRKPETDIAANKPKAEHIVQKGETLFSISNLYNITIDELKKLNNILKGKIKVGQKLKLNQPIQSAEKPEIAQTEPAVSKSESMPQTQPKPANHKVAQGETLFGIAKMNNITVADLKKMNNMTTNKIKNGQLLKLSNESENQNSATRSAISTIKPESTPKLIHHKVKSGESFYSIAKEYNCNVQKLKEWNKKSGSKIKVGEKIIVFAKAD